MKLIKAGMAFALVLLAGCSKAVTWECSCGAADADGNVVATIPEEYCGTEGEAAEAVDEAAGMCATDAPAGTTCACQCDQTDTSC
jgi:hypothetical protein